MNKEIMKALFPEQMEKVEKGQCPFCSNFVVKEDFKNEISLKEFELSGMCQKCQDEFFDQDPE